MVWIKKDETVVDGFVVPREPKYYEQHSNRAKYVAKAICSFGNCRPVKRSQEVEVELITGLSDTCIFFIAVLKLPKKKIQFTK